MGPLAAICAAATWAVASLFFARAGRGVAAAPLNLAKCAIAAAAMMGVDGVLAGRIWPEDLRIEDLGWLVASGLLGLTVGDTAFFEALNRLGPRRALLFWALVPPLTALLAVPLLAEPLTFPMVLGIGVTMAGVVWVVLERTGADGSTRGQVATGLLFGVTAAFCQALGSVLLKRGGTSLSSLEVTLVRLVVGTVGITIHLAVVGRLAEMRVFRRPRILWDATLGTLVGTVAGLWLAVYALQHTYAGVAVTLNATSPLFALPLSIWVLGERVTLRATAGALVAVLGVALLLL
ncbi:MAG: DMT family transporter [Myxococcota bacterium]